MKLLRQGLNNMKKDLEKLVQHWDDAVTKRSQLFAFEFFVRISDYVTDNKLESDKELHNHASKIVRSISREIFEKGSAKNELFNKIWLESLGR